MRTRGPFVLRAMQAALDAALALDPEAAGILAPVEGRRIGIEVVGLGLRFVAVPTGGRICLEPWSPEERPDVSVSGAPASLVALAVKGTGADGLRDGSVSVDGDAATLQALAEAVGRLDVDLEEWLAVRVGDVAARQMGNAARETTAWAKRTGEDFAEDLRDWLVTESGHLAEPESAARFNRDVDALRDDVERLEQRIERLARGS